MCIINSLDRAVTEAKTTPVPLFPPTSSSPTILVLRVSSKESERDRERRSESVSIFSAFCQNGCYSGLSDHGDEREDDAALPGLSWSFPACPHPHFSTLGRLPLPLLKEIVVMDVWQHITNALSPLFRGY